MVKWELVEKVSKAVLEDTRKLERLELKVVEAWMVELVETQWPLWYILRSRHG